MRWSLPINLNIAGTLRAWRSEIIGAALIAIENFFFKDFDPRTDFFGMTTANYKVYHAKYIWIGPIFWMTFDIGATLSGSMTGAISITIPAIAAGTSSSLQGLVGIAENAGSTEVCLAQPVGEQTQIRIYRPTATAYTAGDWRARVNGFVWVI